MQSTIYVIGGKWKTEIIWHLLGGTKRPSELRRLIPKISERVLIDRLRELESDNILERIVYQQIPPKVEYSLTDYGKTLEPVLKAMEKWGAHHAYVAGIESAQSEHDLLP